MLIIMRPGDQIDDLLVARYGDLAYRLAYAITRDTDTARAAVLAAARRCPDAEDWVRFLEVVRAESRDQLETRAPASADPPVVPQHPGDTQSPAIPVDAVALSDAFLELAPHDQHLLWDTLLWRAGTDEDELATALARLEAAMSSRSFPSLEDIP